MNFIRLFLALFLSVTMLFSCSKDESAEAGSPEFYLTCDIDGVPREFNVNCIAARQEDAGILAINVGGMSDASIDPDGMGFIIINEKSGKDITAGTYTDTDPDFELLGSHTVTAGSNYVSGASLAADAASQGKTINHFTAVITELNATTATGTFSGDFYLEGDLSGTPKAVTSGRFHVKFIN